MIAGKPTIANVSMTTANTEYSYAVPAGVSKMLVKLRDATVALKLSYVEGASGTTYVTVPAGSTKTIDELKGGMTIYIQTTEASQVLEVETWK